MRHYPPAWRVIVSCLHCLEPSGKPMKPGDLVLSAARMRSEAEASKRMTLQKLTRGRGPGGAVQSSAAGDLHGLTAG